MKIETLKAAIRFLESKGIESITEIKADTEHWDVITGDDFKMNVPGSKNTAGKPKFEQTIKESPKLDLVDTLNSHIADLGSQAPGFVR